MTFELSVPGSRLLLLDDISADLVPDRHCYWEPTGAVSCNYTLGGALMGGPCSRVAVAEFEPSVCGICNGALSCDSDLLPGHGAPARDVDASDAVWAWLDEEGEIQVGFETLYPFPPGPFVTLWLDDEANPCAIDEAGGILCYQVPERIEHRLEGDFVRGASTRTMTCGLERSGSVHCYGPATDETYFAAEDGFVDVTVTQDVGCGPTRTGVIVCWDVAGEVFRVDSWISR